MIELWKLYENGMRKEMVQLRILKLQIIINIVLSCVFFFFLLKNLQYEFFKKAFEILPTVVYVKQDSMENVLKTTLVF